MGFWNKVWETVTPQNEEAQRKANAALQAANAKIQEAKNFRYGVLANPGARQAFVQQNQVQAPNYWQAAAGIVGNDLSRGFDQFNIFDNNLTWSQRMPTATKSAWEQAGQFGGQAVRNTVPATLRMVNTLAAQVPQVYDTGRMLLADATHNPTAWANANRDAQADFGRFKRGEGGLFNVGTIYDQNEARRGDFKTGFTRIAGNQAQALPEIMSLKAASPVGENVIKDGLKVGLKKSAPALAQSAGYNALEGGTRALNEGKGVKAALKEAATQAVVGTVGDVGFGLAGVAAKKSGSALATHAAGLGEAGSVQLPGKIAAKTTEKAKVEAKSARVKMTQQVHAQMKNRGMEEKDYRALAKKVTGKTSTSQMSDKELTKFRDAIAMKRKPRVTEKTKTYAPIGSAKRDPIVREMLQGLSKSEKVSAVEGNLVTARIQAEAKKLGVTTDYGFIHRYQTGKLEGSAEKKLGKTIQEITDKDFAAQQILDKEIKYTKRHIPQIYEDNQTSTAVSSKKLRTETGAANERKFKTYQAAMNAKNPLTPKYGSLEEILGSRVKDTTRAVKNKEVIDKGLKTGLFNTAGVGDPIPGLKAKGRQIYADKRVTDVVRGVMQRDSQGLGKLAHVVAKIAEVGQDVMLQGGIPGTNLNFFVTAQTAADLTRNVGKAFAGHPIQATEQSVRALATLVRGKQGTIDRFADRKTSKFVSELAEHGLDINPQTKLSTAGEGGVRKAWDSLGNNPTFGRYMPNRMLDTAEEVYKQSKSKGLSHKEAVKLAADTTKTYMGAIDTIAKGRSKMTNDALSAALFAPKYRESILKKLHNVVKAVYPNNWSDPAFKPSRELLGGMMITLAGYEALQQKLTGHSMLDNRDGQQLSLEIPYGPKDEKGNQKVVNIPWMAGFTTVPRSLYKAGDALIHKDLAGTVKELGGSGSSLAQNTATIVSNKDHFGNPIYMDENNARLNGVEPDSGSRMLAKSAVYLAGQFSPAWVRGAAMKLQGKPLEQALATAVEAPIRFGKRPDPKTKAYFEDSEKTRNSLNSHDRAVWDATFGSMKNANGDYMIDQKSIDYGLARASNLLANPKVLEAANNMAKSAMARGEDVDPIYKLDAEKQRIALRMDTIAPGEPVKAKMRKDNPWLTQLAADRNKYYESLPPGDPKKPKGPITYPEPSAELGSKKNAYYQLEDSKMKRDFLKNNPDLVEQFAREEQYTRGVRALKDLPQYDKYPEAPKDVQNIIDFYMSMPSKENNGKSTTRSNWIKSHPDEYAKMTDQLDKQALFSLQRDMQMAAFEGEDPSEKSIKSIASLAKSMGMSGSSSGYSRYGSSGGGRSGSSKGPTVSLSAGGSFAKPKVTTKNSSIYQSSGKKSTSKPKVTIKKSLV